MGITTKKRNLPDREEKESFDFVSGDDDDFTETHEDEFVETIAADSPEDPNGVVVDEQPLIEKSAGPFMTVRRTQEQENATVQKAQTPNRAQRGLAKVKEITVRTTSPKGEEFDDVQHVNR